MANGPARASGVASYASDSTSSFIPALWAAKLVQKFYATTVFGEIASIDYQGLITGQGDKVTIRTRPTITIRDYVIGEGLKYEKPASPSVDLNIDKAKYFGFELNDVEEYQADINLMSEFTDDATEQMKTEIDTGILGDIYGDVDAANTGATAGVKTGKYNMGSASDALSLTKATVLDWLVDVKGVLDEQKLPQTGRWLCIPSYIAGLIMKSDLRDASLTGDSQSPLRNGRIGNIAGLNIYITDNLHTDGSGVTDVIAGHKAGLTFASQMTRMDNIANPSDFGNLVRGLNVYGYKVIEPKYLVHSVVTA